MNRTIRTFIAAPIASFLRFVSTSVRAFSWPYLLTLQGVIIAAPYFLLQPAPCWLRLAWDLAVATFNLSLLWSLFVVRRAALWTLSRHNSKPR